MKIPIYKFIIIILLRHQHGYPWPSLATSPYRTLHLAGPQGYTLYPYWGAVCRFKLVALLLLGHVKGSIGVHHLWARPYFSSCILHVWFNEFYFFKLSEKFAEVTKSFLVRKDNVNQCVNICQYLHYKKTRDDIFSWVVWVA